MIVELLQKAAEQGNIDALVNLGVCFGEGEGIEKNLKKAAELFQIASDQGHPIAQENLGNLFKDGKGVEKDLKKAAVFFQKAADQGNTDAQVSLGALFEKGEGVEKNLSKAIELYQRAADQDNSDAQVNLGNLFKYGTGVEKDLKKAAEYYMKAANQGNARAQTDIGLCYEEGTGVEQDIKTAVELYTKAADQNYPRAQHYLGICFKFGLGVEKNIKISIEYYRKAGKQGFSNSYFKLGELYRLGIDVKQDMGMAISYYQQAATFNNALAQNSLGVCYEQGYGIEKDLKRAIVFYRKSAEQGDDDAQKNLLNCLGKICELPIPTLIKYFDIFEIIETYDYSISLGLFPISSSNPPEVSGLDNDLEVEPEPQNILAAMALYAKTLSPNVKGKLLQAMIDEIAKIEEKYRNEYYYILATEFLLTHLKDEESAAKILKLIQTPHVAIDPWYQKSQDTLSFIVKDPKTMLAHRLECRDENSNSVIPRLVASMLQDDDGDAVMHLVPPECYNLSLTGPSIAAYVAHSSEQIIVKEKEKKKAANDLQRIEERLQLVSVEKDAEIKRLQEKSAELEQLQKRVAELEALNATHLTQQNIVQQKSLSFSCDAPSSLHLYSNSHKRKADELNDGEKGTGAVKAKKHKIHY